MAVIDSIPELAYNEAGLIPCIVQDAKTREVLMMAWMNAESVRLTLKERTTWFFSRSRQELWHKGGTSGNTQALIELRYDCDADCGARSPSPASLAPPLLAAVARPRARQCVRFLLFRCAAGNLR